MSGGHHQSHERQGGRLGPCGACKYLRRKCIKGCVFGPYFNSDEGGAAHFAAVHRVFGASNAAKLLLRIPSHRRRDAVVTLSYEALSRVHDPVYGCVSHILSLHQQIMNMQAELALIQATLSTMQRPSSSSVTFPITFDQEHPNSCFDQISSSSTTTTTTTTTTTVTSMSLFDNGFHTQQTPSPGAELASFCNNLTYYNPDEHMINDIIQDADLQNFTSEFVSKYLPGPSSSPSLSNYN